MVGGVGVGTTVGVTVKSDLHCLYPPSGPAQPSPGQHTLGLLEQSSNLRTHIVIIGPFLSQVTSPGFLQDIQASSLLPHQEASQSL